MKFRRFSSLFIVIAFICGSVYNALAAKPDARSRLYKPTPERHEIVSRSEDSISRYVPLILELATDDDSELDYLEAVVFHRRGRLVLASVPEKNIDRLFHSDLLDRVSCARPAFRNLDVARRLSGVDRLHEGVTVNLQSPSMLALDGTGVLTGIVDMGFDPSHIAFKDRLIYWSIYDEEKAERIEMDGQEAILSSGIETDTPTDTHATHVGNILAGGYKGAPYYGVATGSKFAVSTSAITDVGILAGIEDIIAIAERENLPCVINVSCGSYLGPHDGTDLFNRYLDSLEDRAIICFSAGNYGHRDLYFDVTLDDTVRGCTWCDTRSWDGFRVNGSSDFWSDSDTRFEFQYTVYDCDEKRYIYESPWLGSEDEGLFKLYLDSVPELKPLFKPGGGVILAWGVDSSNNRFNVSVNYGSETEIAQKGGPWARYFTGFRLRAADDVVRVRAWSDGVYSYFHTNGVPGGIVPSKDFSASNFANGNSGIMVGAWNSRNETPIWNSDEVVNHGFVVNRVADWSASGETFSGRKLPDICGPGNILVSAMSKYNLDSEGHPEPSAKTDSDYWYAEAGTSMSSPLVAGIIALWKQYYPELSTERARQILSETANRNFADIDNPRWGSGAVDAVAGLHRLVEYVKSHGVNDVIVGKETVEYYTLQGIRLNSLDGMEGNIVVARYLNPETGKSRTEKILVR
ncbi:MAG: S8 family serine peptidase [Muribaculaceae bacterium]|nr:S8 family serine peptidase [Muribaculaceae bacterium]